MAETHAEEARRLVDEGRVNIIFSNPMSTFIDVLDGQNNHTTQLFANGHYWCDCPWGSIYPHTDDLCAHALAVKLLMEREVADAKV